MSQHNVTVSEHAAWRFITRFNAYLSPEHARETLLELHSRSKGIQPSDWFGKPIEPDTCRRHAAYRCNGREVTVALLVRDRTIVTCYPIYYDSIRRKWRKASMALP